MIVPKKQYKILILPSWYLPEGGQFCKDQALFLKERGLDVHILANVALPWRKYKFKALTLPWRSFESVEDGVLTYRNYYRRIPRLEKANINAWSKRTLMLFDEYVKKHGMPDVIHAHSSMWAGYVAYLIKQKYGVPYVVTEHRGRFGMRSSLAKECFLPMYTDFLKESFSNASYLVPVSDQLIPKIKEFLTKDVPIKTVSNIVDTSLYRYTPRQSKESFTFVAINSYDVVKGYDILLPAFDMLCDKCNKVLLRIAGDNFDSRDFQDILSRCKHKERITFTGWLDAPKVLTELQGADGFVLSSRLEAQPISVLEAISTGLPVVCTEVVPASIITENEGFRVPIEDVCALSQAMLLLVEQRGSFNDKEISMHASSIASPEVVIDKLIEIYDEVLTR